MLSLIQTEDSMFCIVFTFLEDNPITESLYKRDWWSRELKADLKSTKKVNISYTFFLIWLEQYLSG